MGDAASDFINDQVADAVENAGEEQKAAQEETKGGPLGGLRDAAAGQAQDLAVGEM